MSQQLTNSHSGSNFLQMAAVICWIYSFRCFPLDYTTEPTCNLDFAIRTRVTAEQYSFCLIIENYFVFIYLLTPWSRVLETLTCSQLVKKFPVFYGTRRFITTFTRARHLSLSWARSRRLSVIVILFTTTSRPSLGPNQPRDTWGTFAKG
jgi:prolipoprotein diacylglyceryltransferase